jgi:hypothetical protein
MPTMGLSRLTAALIFAVLPQLILLPAAHAQLIAARKAPCEKVAAGLAYDVVSIRPAKPSGDINNQSSSWSGGGDGFHATNVQLSLILQPTSISTARSPAPTPPRPSTSPTVSSSA